MKKNPYLGGFCIAALLSVLACQGPTSGTSSSDIQALLPVQVQGFELVAGVPADFFLVTGSRVNPERDFVEAHWARVAEAFRSSGVAQDLLAMVTANAPAEMTETASGIFETMIGLMDAVDWRALSSEVVFAQRLNVSDFSGAAASFGAPDMVFLYRVDAETGPGIFANLVELERGILDQVQQLSGVEIELELARTSGMDFTVLDFQATHPAAPNYPISIGLRENAVVLTIGAGVRAEVAALLAGEGSPISSTQHFQSAFTDMPGAEDGFEFVDMANLRSNVKDTFDVVSSLLDSELDSAVGENGEVTEHNVALGSGLELAQGVMDLVLEGMSLADVSMSVRYTEGHSVLTEKRAVLAPDAKDNLFYPLLQTLETVEDFAQYLPASTTAFSVHGGFDLEAIYDFALDAIRNLGPMGSVVLGEWESFQEEKGFSLRRDVLAWIDGETVKADFTLNNEDAWVTRMRVRDEAMANEKLSMGLGMLPMLVEMAAKENPMLKMVGLSVSPSSDSRFEGFSELKVAMLGTAMLCGVKDGWVVFGSSADAIALTEATARAELPNVRENVALMADAVVVEGPVSKISFSDYSSVTADLADGLEGLAMMGGMVIGMIDEPEARRVATAVLRLLGNLAPVLRQIDFFRSGSSVVTFDGEAWHTKSVTNYAGLKQAPLH